MNKKLKYYKDLYDDNDVFVITQPSSILGDVFIMTEEKLHNLPLSCHYAMSNIVTIVGDDVKISFKIHKHRSIIPRRLKSMLVTAFGIDQKFLDDELNVTDGPTIMYLKMRFPEL
jgi:hypothetical protein